MNCEKFQKAIFIRSIVKTLYESLDEEFIEYLSNEDIIELASFLSTLDDKNTIDKTINNMNSCIFSSIDELQDYYDIFDLLPLHCEGDIDINKPIKFILFDGSLQLAILAIKDDKEIDEISSISRIMDKWIDTNDDLEPFNLQQAISTIKNCGLSFKSDLSDIQKEGEDK